MNEVDLSNEDSKSMMTLENNASLKNAYIVVRLKKIALMMVFSFIICFFYVGIYFLSDS